MRDRIENNLAPPENPKRDKADERYFENQANREYALTALEALEELAHVYHVDLETDDSPVDGIMGELRELFKLKGGHRDH